MANIIQLNFKGVEPVQSGGFDYIAPGVYRFVVQSAEVQDSKKGNPMIVTQIKVVKGGDGRQDGKGLTDYFVVPSDEVTSQFGLQRFGGMLKAIGLKVPKGNVKLDLNKIVGKNFVGRVDDSVLPATDEQEERTVSKLIEYILPDSVSDDDADDDDDEETPDDDDTDSDDGDDDDEPEETAKEKKQRLKKEKAAKKAKKDDDADDDDDSDDLFGDLD